MVSGRVTGPEGKAYWTSLGDLPRSELPLRTRDALRWWRMMPWPPLELWSGEVDWVYAPAEYDVPTRRARRAVTSHDVLQDVRQGGPRRLRRLARAFGRADLIASVSRFNTEQLLETFPDCRGRVAYVPNGAEDLFFEPATEDERSGVRVDLGLPDGLPYLLSVANFQPRKNLIRLVRAASRLPEVASGELGLVFLGTGDEPEVRGLRSAIAEVGPRASIRMPGYRQGEALRATYAEAEALVFPSLCESFGIPAVEAMAQGIPVALADSTALPEIGGEAGWYFDPEDEDALTGTLRDLLDRRDERARRVELGRSIAEGYRWQAANDLLVAALMGSS
jgi:alpha-1,3-rhamnosyl/mannosyltransferase